MDLQRRYQCHIARPIPNAPPPMYPAVCYYYSTSGTRLLAPPCARSAPPPTYPATKLYSVRYQELEVQFFGGLKLAPPTLQKSAPHLTSHWIIHSLVTRVILPSEITISAFQDRDVEEVQWICECYRTNIYWHKIRYSHICQQLGSVLTSRTTPTHRACSYFHLSRIIQISFECQHLRLGGLKSIWANLNSKGCTFLYL